jgi:site-specific DNA-methyltransferase (adenine-specific)
VRPYYEREGITIYHGDCREILPTLASVDLVLTDPPYGLGDKWNGGGGTSKSSWRFNPDEAKEWDGDVSEGVPELGALGDAIVWGGNYYAMAPSRSWLIWDKKQNDQFTTGQAELAWTNLDIPVRVFRMSQVEAYCNPADPKLHPTQKPIALIKWCIGFAPDALTLLDPFMGSGTTLRAAKDLGRKAIGIELEERYCEIAAKRLSQEVLL